MTNKILALKYRPQEFKDLIGQEVMAQTITNAIKLGKTPNAYLLTGIRGVGKMAVMLYMYVEVLYWFMALPQDEVSTQATALTATVTGAISGAYGLWLGNEKS